MFSLQRLWIKSRKKVYEGDNKCTSKINLHLVGVSYAQKFNEAIDVNESFNVVKLGYYGFDSLSGWKESVSLKHP